RRMADDRRRLSAKAGVKPLRVSVGFRQLAEPAAAPILGMPVMRPDKPPGEGVLREDAGTTDKAGFIAPSIDALEHALYFTTAPSVTEKVKQVLNEGRLLLPGVVVVWDETVGRRKGAKAVPKSWWADAGSLTAAFAFPPRASVRPQER